MKAKTIDSVIVATTIEKEDNEIVEITRNLGANVYRGSENDVLDRYYQTATNFKVDHIVRITADCPLIDPAIIDCVVAQYRKDGADYCCNTLPPTFPDGLDAEVFSYAALKDAWKNAKLRSEREHVTPYIKKHPEKFAITVYKNKKNLSDKRWTLDNPEDYEFVKVVINGLSTTKRIFHMEDILEFLSKNPQVESINKHIRRNESYQKSLKEDGMYAKG